MLSIVSLVTSPGIPVPVRLLKMYLSPTHSLQLRRLKSHDDNDSHQRYLIFGPRTSGQSAGAVFLCDSRL